MSRAPHLSIISPCFCTLVWVKGDKITTLHGPSPPGPPTSLPHLFRAPLWCTQSIIQPSKQHISLHIDQCDEHKFPFLNGKATEQGAGKGKGYTVNPPLLPGMGDLQVAAIWKLHEFTTVRRNSGSTRKMIPPCFCTLEGAKVAKVQPLGPRCFGPMCPQPPKSFPFSLVPPMVRKSQYTTFQVSTNF